MSVTIDDIVITHELAKRRRIGADLSGENRLLHGLARSLGEPTPRLLASFVEDALYLTGAGSAGVSLLEKDDSGAEIFRWAALSGAYKSFTGGTTPGNFSPCGTCLERKSPQLYAAPARYFDYFAKVQPPIVEGLVVPIWTAGGAVGTIWVVSHDAVARFNLEDARLLSSIAGFLGNVLVCTESSARYRALSACSPMGVFETDMFGRVTYANERFHTISGFRPRKIVGRNWSSVLPASDRAKIFADWGRKTKKNVDYTAEVAFERPSGEVRWVSLRSAPLRYDGIVKGCVSSVEDVTARKATEIALIKAQQETERYAGNLESRVAERTGQLEKANAQLRTLAAQLTHAQEEERRKLAHQLHDEIGQELTGLKLLLTPSRTKQNTNHEAMEVLAELITQVGHLAQDLRPAVLERLGLLAALRWQAGRLAKQNKLKVILNCHRLSEDDLTTTQKVEVFRIVQEALTNSVRHSGVKTARVHFKREKNRLEVSIQDRGKGFDLKRVEKKASLGLLGMRERVSRLGGEINITSISKRGTKVELWIPLFAPFRPEENRAGAITRNQASMTPLRMA